MSNVKRGNLFLISAPSGTGKSTICDALIRQLTNIERLITYTTRPPREGEINGIDYHFITENKFNEMISQKKFAEHANVYGFYYGNSKQDIETLLYSRKNILLNIDVQGAKTVRNNVKDCVSIFILPPSLQELRERLEKRGKDDKETIERRLKIAEREMEQSKHFTYSVVNDHLDKTVSEIKNLIENIMRKAY